MKRLLMSTFASRIEADAVVAALRADPCFEQGLATRLHEGELDLRLSIDIDDTPASGADERNVVARFGIAFVACTLVGVVLDIFEVVADSGLVMTMTLGSLGVFVGMAAVLLARPRPLDAALALAARRLEEGGVLLTVAIDEGRAAAVEASLVRHGGDRVFTA